MLFALIALWALALLVRYPEHFVRTPKVGNRQAKPSLTRFMPLAIIMARLPFGAMGEAGALLRRRDEADISTVILCA
jgi:hypothetical protein